MPVSHLTREQIEALSACGPAAIVALVEHLQQTVTDLTARIDLLEERLGRNSRNSNQPPSSDGFNRPPRSSRQPSGKKPGGQPGHPGQTLRFSAHPDRIIVQRPTHCRHCGGALPAQPLVWRLRCLLTSTRRAFKLSRFSTTETCSEKWHLRCLTGCKLVARLATFLATFHEKDRELTGSRSSISAYISFV